MAEVTNLELFHEAFRERDHEEALIINELFDRHIAIDPTDKVGALALAFADTEDALISRYPFAGEMGYEAAKRAMRWWNYRTAYERDYADLFEPQKVIDLGEGRNEAGDQILSGSLLHIAWYALADAGRLQVNQKGREIADILANEKQSAYALLLSTFDDLLFGEQPKLVRHRYKKFTGEVQDEHGKRLITITRSQGLGNTDYEYSEEAPVIVADEQTDRHILTYIFEERDGTIDVHGIGAEMQPIELETETALYLASLVSRGEDYLYEARSTSWR